jgi:hypothetical protein
VARHLAAARRRVGGGADGLQQDLLGGSAEAEHEGPVPVVGEEPVRPGAQLPSQAEQQGLVTRPGDLEENPALLLQGDLAIVEVPGHEGRAEILEHLLHGKLVEQGDG